MSRQAGSGPQFVAPGARPWAARGGGHPLAAFGGGGAAAAAPAALSLPYEAAGAYRSAPLGRPAGMSMPRFTLGQAAAPSFSAKNHQAMPKPPALAHVAAALGQAAAALPDRSNRSQEDDLLLASQGLVEQLVGDNAAAFEAAVAVGSAPQPAALERAANQLGDMVEEGFPGPSQPEVSRRPIPVAAARLLQDIHRRVPDLAGDAGNPAALEGLSRKVDALQGQQGTLAVAVGHLQTDLSGQGRALEGIGKACAEVLQAVQSMAGTSCGLEDRLRELLAAKKPVTGDMTTQTTPSLAPPQPPAAAVAAVPPSIQAFSKRRASSSSGAPKGTAAPAKRTAALPPPGVAAPASRGLAGPAVAAAAQLPGGPTAMPGSAGKARAKAGSAGKARRQPMAAIQDAAAATPASFSRKRGQEAGASQQGQGATPAERSPPVQQQLQQQSARPSKQARRAEVLFDSLFSEEQEQVPPQQPAPRLAATPAAAAAAAAPTGCGGSPDLAAAVRRKLQKHQARFARRRGASQRQAEEDQA